jgi:hypothetical protein
MSSALILLNQSVASLAHADARRFIPLRGLRALAQLISPPARAAAFLAPVNLIGREPGPASIGGVGGTFHRPGGEGPYVEENSKLQDD